MKINTTPIPAYKQNDSNDGKIWKENVYCFQQILQRFFFDKIYSDWSDNECNYVSKWCDCYGRASHHKHSANSVGHRRWITRWRMFFLYFLPASLPVNYSLKKKWLLIYYYDYWFIKKPKVTIITNMSSTPKPINRNGSEVWTGP